MPQVWKLGNLEAHRKQGEAVDSFAAHYAPPELANGGDAKANPKMDIFSLGLVGLEMLSGTPHIPTTASTKEALRKLSSGGLQAALQSATSALPPSHKALLDKMLKHYQGKDAFVQDCYAGAHADYRLKVRVVTEEAWHNLFARNMFIQPQHQDLENFEPEFTVIQAPSLTAALWRWILFVKSKTHAITCCATLGVEYAGTFVTATPCFSHASRSTLFTPVAVTLTRPSVGTALRRESVISTLLTTATSALLSLSTTSLGAERSYTTRSSPARSAGRQAASLSWKTPAVAV